MLTAKLFLIIAGLNFARVLVFDEFNICHVAPGEPFLYKGLNL